MYCYVSPRQHLFERSVGLTYELAWTGEWYARLYCQWFNEPDSYRFAWVASDTHAHRRLLTTMVVQQVAMDFGPHNFAMHFVASLTAPERSSMVHLHDFGCINAPRLGKERRAVCPLLIDHLPH